MTVCLKTGARLWLENYGASVAADIHTIDANDERVFIAKFNPNSWNYDDKRINCDWALEFFSSDHDVFWQKEQGIAVAGVRFIHCINAPL